MAKKQFGVLGLGRFGTSVALTLAESGYEVIAMDTDMERVQNVAAFVTQPIQGDVSDESVLRAAGINNCDIVVVAIGSHLESSVLATLIVKQMGVPYVVSKAPSITHGNILEKIGADKVTLPEKEMGIRIANNLMSGNIFEFIELSSEYGIVEIRPLKKWIGKTLANSNIRAEYGFNIVAIKNDKKMSVTPSASRVIYDDDVLIAIGENLQIQNVFKAAQAGE